MFSEYVPYRICIQPGDLEIRSKMADFCEMGDLPKIQYLGIIKTK